MLSVKSCHIVGECRSVGRVEGNVKGKVAGLVSYSRRNSIGTKAFFRSAQTCFGPGAPRGQKSLRDTPSRGSIT